jgi:hypothetical protein
MLFGADPAKTGEILIDGRKVAVKNPNTAVRNGIGLATEDRKCPIGCLWCTTEGSRARSAEPTSRRKESCGMPRVTAAIRNSAVPYKIACDSRGCPAGNF